MNGDGAVGVGMGLAELGIVGKGFENEASAREDDDARDEDPYPGSVAARRSGLALH